MMAWIRRHTFLIILFSVVNLILTPLTSYIAGINGELMAVINFTIMTLISLLSTQKPLTRVIIFMAAGMTLISVWTEFMGYRSDWVFEVRIISTFAMFVTLAYILINNILSSDVVNLKVIFGAIAGYIIIGLIGGTLFEFIQYIDSESIISSKELSGYDFYYYSFISLITIGYGDILPQSPHTQSLTIALGVIGQFYMAIGVALFVGRHLSEKNRIAS